MWDQLRHTLLEMNLINTTRDTQEQLCVKNGYYHNCSMCAITQVCATHVRANSEKIEINIFDSGSIIREGGGDIQNTVQQKPSASYWRSGHGMIYEPVEILIRAK